MSMSSHQRCLCSGCDQDPTVTTSNRITLDTYDQLLTHLLSVKDFIRCRVFPRAFYARFNVLLDRLSASGQNIPYVPPSEDLIQAVHKFVRLAEDNWRLLDGIISSTGISLSEIAGS